VQDVDELFAELRPLLARHASSLVVIADEPGDYQVSTSRAGPSGTHMLFGSVQAHEGHVSVQLMPVASHPGLLGELSDDLRGRMQGKGCFNLTPQDASAQLLGELSQLVDLGLERYRADGLA
jgi:hypothetical protein